MPVEIVCWLSSPECQAWNTEWRGAENCSALLETCTMMFFNDDEGVGLVAVVDVASAVKELG